MDEEQQHKVAEFSYVTGVDASRARACLEYVHWDLETAVSDFFADRPIDENGNEVDHTGTSRASRPPLSSTPQQASSSSQQPPRRPPGQRPKQMTMRDLQRGMDDDEDDEDDRNQDMFAGGEKSGLAVQNPDSAGGGGGPVDHFRNIMNQARANRDRPDRDNEDKPERSSHFTGRARTLGGDDTPSVVIDPGTSAARGPTPQRLPRVTRTLHLWADGISIDDGPLFRFTDPANQEIMAQINQGRAPLSLLDVQPDQEVDLNLIPHKDENYVAPKPKYKPFSGQGQRLGSPTPGPAPSSSVPSTAAAAPPSTSSSASQSSKLTEMPIDESVPTIRLQIRLGDGSRLQSRFNTTHTIGDVYDFVNRASTSSTQRPYVLMTTFPNKDYTDKSLQLGKEFQRGGSLVQKWV